MFMKGNKSLIFFIGGLILCLVGWHNIDLSFNLFQLKNYYGLEIVDVSLAGIEQTWTEGYRSGSFLLFLGLILLVLGYLAGGRL